MKRRCKSSPIDTPPTNVADGSSREATDDSQKAPEVPSLLVGIDWADGEHTYELLDPHGKTHCGTVEQTREALHAWLDDWRKKFPDARIDICLETSRGPLINVLLEQAQVRIFPVNPNALANYRKAFAHGGGKNDPVDAALVLQYLRHYRSQLRPLQLNLPITRELAALCEDRRALVENRVKLAQQLKAMLKAYFPAILQMKPAQIYADFIVHLLQKYPTLADVQAAGRIKLRKLFYGLGTKERIEMCLDVLMNAKPLATDEVLLKASARRAQAICSQLASLNESIQGYDDEIERLVKQHPDYQVVQSLPCGAKSKARILAAVGDDRERYQSAEALAAATGIAPLTTQSGKQRTVSSRWACTKFMRKTFHEFAGLSILKSRWAKAYYDQQIGRGKTPQMARRALAFKWIRIIYRCWQAKEPYHEARYGERLTATQSPLALKLTA
jgi:transposase